MLQDVSCCCCHILGAAASLPSMSHVHTEIQPCSSKQRHALNTAWKQQGSVLGVHYTLHPKGQELFGDWGRQQQAVAAGPVPNLMQTALYLWPYMYNSIYGRFLLLQLGGVGSVLVLNLLMSLFSIVGNLSSRHSPAPSLTLDICRAASTLLAWALLRPACHLSQRSVCCMGVLGMHQHSAAPDLSSSTDAEGETVPGVSLMESRLSAGSQATSC